MSATGQRVAPVLGERAKRAAALSADWESRTERKLLLLIAAFADAGERRPLARGSGATAGHHRGAFG